MFPDDYDPYQGVLVEETPKMHESIQDIQGIHYHCYICSWSPKNHKEIGLLNPRVYETQVAKGAKPNRFVISYCNNCLYLLKP